MEKHMPRIMIAGTNSGCGKTTMICGILSAFKQRGVDTAACKCGPDYIDPMFHSLVFGIPSQNLDLFFSTKEQINYLLTKDQDERQLTLMEGVMGFYDGMQMDSTKASSYDLAKTTNTPVVLVINCKGMALSVVPMIKGFLEFRTDHTIKGVILNGVTKMTGKMLTEIIERELPVKVYGCVPKLEEFQLASRHLGLVTPHELDGIKEDMEHLGTCIEDYIDMDGLQELAETAPDLSMDMPKEWKEDLQEQVGAGINIGVAFDAAFCFYYKDNLELLQRLGCKITYFSPLKDKKLPEQLDGLLFGGGYPEIYARQLSENREMIQEIGTRLAEGLPCLAECGGFMYLHEEMEDEEGNYYPMVGAVKGRCSNQKKLVRFGYINIESKEENEYLPKGEEIKAHEFHYWDSTNNGEVFVAKKPSGKRSWNCCHVNENGIWGYPHLYYYSNLKVILRFLKQTKKKRG